MLSPDEARDIAAVWRPQFIDESAFETSWTRFFEMVGDPTRTRLEQWLAKDRQKDEVVHAGVVKEPLLPTRSGFQLSDCRHCWSDEAGGGMRYIRRDVDINHPDFGKAIPCPSCNR
jgi:hypothetical protein